MLQKDHVTKLDEPTFEKLFRELYPLLCRYCIQFVHNPVIAEEIVQEQFIYFWEKKAALQIHTSFKSYFYKSVKNRSIDYLRNRYANIKFVPEEASANLPENLNPQKIAEAKDMISAVTEAVEKLPESCRVVFSLSRYGEFTNKEIAEKLDISVKTVENQITNAIRRIKIHLQKLQMLD